MPRSVSTRSAGLAAKSFAYAAATVAAFLEARNLTKVGFDTRHYRIVEEGLVRFGRENRHAAGLNLGDYLSYAGAKVA